MRFNRKTDDSQNDIVKDLRKIPGVSVELDKDDILVGYKGKTYWFEIKTSAKSEIKDRQLRLQATWRGHYAIVWSLNQILKEVGIEDADLPTGGKK